MAEKGQFIKESIATATHVVKMQQAQARIERLGDANPHKAGIPLPSIFPLFILHIYCSIEDMQIVMQEGLKTIWKLGKLEINATLRNVCEMVLEDKTLPRKMRKQRAKALKRIGEVSFIPLSLSLVNIAMTQQVYSHIGKQMEKAGATNIFQAFDASAR